MLTKGFLKPRLSVATIGKGRFSRGLLLGLAAAVVLHFVFSFGREAMRSISLTGVLVQFPERDLLWYDLFFAALAVCMGTSVAICFWLQGRNRVIRKKHLFLFAITIFRVYQPIGTSGKTGI
jgi:hypothetical protein